LHQHYTETYQCDFFYGVTDWYDTPSTNSYVKNDRHCVQAVEPVTEAVQVTDEPITTQPPNDTDILPYIIIAGISIGGIAIFILLLTVCRRIMSTQHSYHSPVMGQGRMMPSWTPRQRTVPSTGTWWPSRQRTAPSTGTWWPSWPSRQGSWWPKFGGATPSYRTPQYALEAVVDMEITF